MEYKPNTRPRGKKIFSFTQFTPFFNHHGNEAHSVDQLILILIERNKLGLTASPREEERDVPGPETRRRGGGEEGVKCKQRRYDIPIYNSRSMDRAALLSQEPRISNGNRAQIRGFLAGQGRGQAGEGKANRNITELRG